MTTERTVLFVDDDEIVLRSLQRGLLDEPYNQLFAKSGEQALEILREQEVHVLVTDMRMPGMDGLELLKAVGQEYPDIVKMVLSGYAQSSDLMTAVYQEGVFRFVPKPWELEADLKGLIQKAFDHYELQKEHQAIAAEAGKCRSGNTGIAE